MSTNAITVVPRPRTVAGPKARPPGRATSRRPGEGAVLFGVFSVVYLSVAWFMLRQDLLFGDALSRVANSFYVLYSREPHLAAIGFVWNPLPSLVLLPLLPFKALFPVLVERGFAGSIQSALSMAVAVACVAVCLRKLGVRRTPRLLLTVLFALHPMIVLYAGSGLSEAMLLCFLLLTVSALITWVDDQHARRLVLAGVALGLAYLTRYEAAAPALAVSVFVGAVTFRRSTGPRSFRLRLTLNDVVLVAAPFVFAFVTWAAMAKILVDEWLPTFTSVYGNTRQVTDALDGIRSATGETTAETLTYVSGQVHGLTPFVVPLLVAALAAAVWRRRPAMMVAPVVLGAVLLFVDLALIAGASFGWLRFQVTVIPLTVLLAGAVVAAFTGRGIRTVTYLAVVALAPAMVAAGLPIGARTLTDPIGGFAREESAALRATFLPHLASEEEVRALGAFRADRRIAADLDRLGLGEGSVLTDAAYASPIIIASSRPTQFVINSDPDFADAVADPGGHGVRYLLVPTPESASQDALGRRWTNLHSNGAGIATLVAQWPASRMGWRLYRLL